MDLGGPDVIWLDVVVGFAPGLPVELGVLEVEVGCEPEVPAGRGVLVGDEVVVDVPEPPGSDGKVGVETVGIETVGIGRFGVGRFGVETVGIVSADADGNATMPTPASNAIAPTTSSRFRNTVVNLLPRP